MSAGNNSYGEPMEIEHFITALKETNMDNTIGLTADEVAEITNALTETLPYGMYTTTSGRQVLFSRGYAPMWTRDDEGRAAKPADPEEWIEDIARQEWFLDRRRRKPWPHLSLAHRLFLASVLEDFKAGRPVRGEPGAEVSTFKQSGERK